MRTLYIDAGNTFVKMAEYCPPHSHHSVNWHGSTAPEDKGWNFVARLQWEQQELEQFFPENIERYNKIVMVSVRNSKRIATLLKQGNLKNNAEVIILDHSVLTQDNCSYKTPKTLGMDRFFSCLGAWSINNQESRTPEGVLVSDAGTACTIDIMDKKGTFLGGIIMPGHKMVSDTISSRAENLFDTKVDVPDVVPPDTTEKAIQLGTHGTFLFAWHAHIEKLSEHYPETSIWLTGGDAEFILNHSSLKITYNPFLVFEGMRHYLCK